MTNRHFAAQAIARLHNGVARPGLAIALALTGFSSIAHAQEVSPAPVNEAEAATDTTVDSKGIVVTGTLIRGIAPAGSEVIALGRDQILATGGTSTNQILTAIPQIGNMFNQVPAGVSPQSGANGTNPITRPNLRNLPGGDTAGGAQTLVLFDGHRVVGAGIAQVAVDPDVLAPGVIERVDAMTDGGSAVYGSDAIGGVLNFITRRKFDGIRVGARYGFGDEYTSYDGNIMAGKDWGTGGLYVAFGYSHHDAIFGADRDFVKQIDWNTGIPTGRNCTNPNVTVTNAGVNTSYVVSGNGIVTGTPNACDSQTNLTIYPRNTLYNGYARFTQDLNDAITVDISGFYANRKVVGNGGTLGFGLLGTGNATTATLTSTNPSYRNPGGANAGLSEVVNFNLSALFGDRSAPQVTTLKSFSVDPSISVDLGGGWQARGLMSYGNAKTAFRNTGVNSSNVATAITAGTLNPFNVGASSVGSTLRADTQGTGRNELYDFRAIVDGPLFELPGGAVRAALGYEHMRDEFQRRSTSATTFAFLPPTKYVQNIDSFFGELQIPIIDQIRVSASGRYDSYSDFGHKFNPKLGATINPVEWFTIRGSWGKSFTAPSPVDQLGVTASTVATVPAQFLAAPPGTTAVPGETGLFVAGTAVGIQPQTAKNWSVGAELKPPMLEGLTLSATYYHIDLSGTIGRPVGVDLTPFYNGFKDLYLVRPSGQTVAAYLQQFNPSNVSFTLVNPTSTAQAIVQSGATQSPVLVVLDTRGRNLGVTHLSGLDFQASYILKTSFGSLDGGIFGNYRINQKTQSNQTAAIIDDLKGNSPRATIQGRLGATVEGLRAQVTWNHTAGFTRADVGTAAAFGQTRISALDTINLYAAYNVPASWLGPDLQLTFNVNNLFDVAPPVFKSATLPGFNTSLGQGFTIGRIFQFGVSKKF